MKSSVNLTTCNPQFQFEFLKVNFLIVFLFKKKNKKKKIICEITHFNEELQIRNKTSQLTFTCLKSTIATLEKGIHMLDPPPYPL